MGFATLASMNTMSRRRIVTGQTQRLAGRSAKEIKRMTNIKIDGTYWVRPSKTSSPQIVWCDMNTDGGGWMMIARTHPTSQDLQGQNFGWRGGPIGGINDFSRPYQLGFFTNWYSVGARFSEFAFGNQAYSNQNGFGPYAYKHVLSAQNFIDLMTTDNVMGQNAYSTIKYPANYLSLYASASAPWMQSLYGWAVIGTQSNVYWLRDVSGWSSSSYAMNYWGMSTAYLGDPTYGLSHAGPWGAGATINADGSYNQVGANEKLGGTNQVVLMVRE